jgi:hypothetical protein
MTKVYGVKAQKTGSIVSSMRSFSDIKAIERGAVVSGGATVKAQKAAR